MAKYNIYAVAYGIDPKTKEPIYGYKFHNWNDCKPYVVGIDGAKYKGFLTEEEANIWLEKSIKKEDTHPVTDEISVMISNVADTINQRNSPVHGEFENVCKELGVSTWDMMLCLEKQFVEQHRFVKTKQNN